MNENLVNWLNSWQNLNLDGFRSILPSLNLPGAIAIYSSSGSLLQVSYLGNLQKFEQLICQFGPIFQLLEIFDPEFYMGYWTFPPGLTNLEVELPDAIARIAEDLPLQSKKSMSKIISKQRSLPIPFSDPDFADATNAEEELTYA